MTREEAIDIIRKNIPHLGIGATEMTDALKELIPELREGEDERNIDTIFNCLYQCCDTGFISRTQRDNAIAYLEKQKEQPTDAKTERVIKAARRVLNNWLDGTDCPDVSGDFVELEYAIHEYDGEEKQKEPTPADGWDYADKRMSHPLYLEGFEAGRAVERELSEFEKQKEQKRDNLDEQDKIAAAYQLGRSDERKQKEQKPVEWSEEDEKKRKGLIKGLEDRMGFGWASDPFSREEYIEWLKYLCPQKKWKPSEEQMSMLRAVINEPNNSGAESCQIALRGIYEQLKKL